MPHIHKGIDFTVGAAIAFDRRILLIDHPRYGFWLMPGGHVELHEDTDEAPFREIKEETSLKADDIEIVAKRSGVSDSGGAKALFVPNWMNIHPANPPHRHIGLYYAIRSKTDHVQLEKDVHAAIRWFSEDESASTQFPIPADVRYVGREAIHLLS